LGSGGGTCSGVLPGTDRRDGKHQGGGVAPGAERIAWSTYDGSSNVDATTIRVARVPDCQPEREFHRPGRSDVRLELSNRLLAELKLGALTLSSLTTGAGSATGLPASSLVRAFSLSPEGELIAVAYRARGSREERVRVAHAADAESLNDWTVAEDIGRLRWVSDHSILAIGATSVEIYDVTTGGRTAGGPAPDGTRRLLGANANGTFLAEASGRTVHVRNLATGEEYARIERSAADAFAFLPDVLQMATVDFSTHALRRWTMQGARAVAELGEPPGMHRVEFSRDSAAVYTRAGSAAVAWRLPAPSDLPGPPTENGSAPPATASPYIVEHNEHPIGSNEKGWLELRRGSGGPIVLRLDLDTRVGVLAAALSEDLQLLAVITGKSTRGGWESRLELWEVQSGKRRAAAQLGFLGDRYAGRVQITPDTSLRSPPHARAGSCGAAQTSASLGSFIIWTQSASPFNPAVRSQPVLPPEALRCSTSRPRSKSHASYAPNGSPTLRSAPMGAGSLPWPTTVSLGCGWFGPRILSGKRARAWLDLVADKKVRCVPGVVRYSIRPVLALANTCASQWPHRVFAEHSSKADWCGLSLAQTNLHLSRVHRAEISSGHRQMVAFRFQPTRRN